MSYNQSQNTQSGDCGCVEPGSPTQKETINRFRDDYCKEVYELKGKVAELEVKKVSLDNLISEKQCWFVWTERHYRIHRNLSLMITTELLQTGDSIKEGVKNYLGSNKLLADALKKLSKSIKDVKDKTYDLRAAACKLRDCKDDICNCSQIIELLGETPGNCSGGDDKNKKERPQQCNNIKDVLDKLICMPSNLSFDIDSIFKSSLDVAGIQTFSNITSLDGLQTELSDRIKKFEKQVQDTIKQSETDLKSVLDDLVKSKKDLAKTEVDLYGKRSDFEGVRDAVQFYCCAECNCVIDECDCSKRLENCEKDICKICKDVQTSSCPDQQPQPQDC